MRTFTENRKVKTSILIVLFIFSNFINCIPKVAAPPPPLLPNQIISEILANRTLSLNLLNTDALVEIDSLNYPDIIRIDFNANYTIFNAENASKVELGLPFSLGINVVKSNFNVKLNNTPINFVLENYTQATINNTEFDLDFFISKFILENPIIIIKCNLTILKYETIKIEYDFNGLVVNPLNFWDELDLGYYLNTSKTWNGYTTGKVEIRVFGKSPTFSTTGNYFNYVEVTVSDIFKGKSCIWEWNNAIIYHAAIFGIHSYDYTSYPNFTLYYIFLIIINTIAYILIISAIVYFIVRKKSRKKSQEALN